MAKRWVLTFKRLAQALAYQDYLYGMGIEADFVPLPNGEYLVTYRGEQGVPFQGLEPKAEQRETPQQRYLRSEKGKQAVRRYRQSPKGREAIRRYNRSEKARLTRLRYFRSEKWKETKRRWRERRRAQGQL